MTTTYFQVVGLVPMYPRLLQCQETPLTPTRSHFLFCHIPPRPACSRDDHRPQGSRLYLGGSAVRLEHCNVPVENQCA